MADLIDRKALIAKCGEWYVEEGPEDGFIGTLKTLLDMAPAVDAEPVKRGKWLTCEDGWGDVHYQCSVCGNEWYLEDGTPEENGMNYCSHCGAKMEVGE